VTRRVGGLAFVAAALVLLAAFDALLAAGPAFGLSALGAWLITA
jgi:hypothetical protein